MLEILQYILESYYRTSVVLFALFLISRIRLFEIKVKDDIIEGSLKKLTKKIRSKNESQRKQ